jgi:hypothetical protein
MAGRKLAGLRAHAAIEIGRRAYLNAARSPEKAQQRPPRLPGVKTALRMIAQLKAGHRVPEPGKIPGRLPRRTVRGTMNLRRRQKRSAQNILPRESPPSPRLKKPKTEKAQRGKSWQKCRRHSVFLKKF